MVALVDVGSRSKLGRAGLLDSESEVIAKSILKKPVHPILERREFPEGIPARETAGCTRCHDLFTSLQQNRLLRYEPMQVAGRKLQKLDIR
jgi:hypothetical protein